jgi:glutamate dehydrogenase
MLNRAGSAGVEEREALLKRLTESFNEQLNGSVVETITDFARVFFAHFPLQDWSDRPYSDILGCCYTLWHQLQTPRNQLPVVRVFNPSLDEHGWLAGRTVITVLQRDMPFLVDSIRLQLNKRDVPIHILKSSVMHIGRNAEGVPVKVLGGGEKPKPAAGIEFEKDALLYMEISLHSSDAELASLRKAVQSVLNDVAIVVDQFDDMLQCTGQLAQNLSQVRRVARGRDVQEVIDFLQWLADSHFTFLGYREYDLVEQGAQRVLRENPAARKGVYCKLEGDPQEITEQEFSRGMREFHDSDSIISFSKGANRSHIHRAVYPDYVVVKRFDESGQVCGEARFLGLFTYSVYTLTPTQIPLVRQKVARIIELSGLDPDSHDGKNLRRVIESYPRDELFQTPLEELYTNVVGVANINERHVVRLFMRKDPFGKFVTSLVYVPRDVYTTEIRLKIERLIGDAIQAKEVDSTTYFSESLLARAQMVFRVDADQPLNYDVSQLEAGIVAITRSWRDQLEHAFVEALGEGAGLKQYRLYKNAFSSGYQESFDARTAVHDIGMLDRLNADCSVAMNFYQPLTADQEHMRFKVLHEDGAIELSQVVPVLEHLGLRVLGEHPYQIRPADGRTIWLHDFELRFGLPVTLDVHAVRHLFEDAFASVWRGDAESDAFNRLVLGARLTWREVTLLRTYAAYMKQTAFNFSQDYIADTLANHLEITRNLVALFKAYFNPRVSAKAFNSGSHENVRELRIKEKILAALEQVPNLNEDRILRHYLELIEASLRTNFFQKDGEGNFKNYISIKFNSQAIPGIPKPKPQYEIFVFSRRVEGVHLRGGKVARGGLRWSDRLQDYRTEVLGLMKAQQVKNAVIVPTGAKGGFVPKQMPVGIGREERQKEGIECYKIFIRGLLDLTDNFVEGQLVPPQDVVRRDDDDAYLVVAADKGTATFSDIANEISRSYGHWLGDAFASGGSQGYDHKKMGITARGAWVSVQRHFREQGLDIQTTDFAVIGIGDMGGDVFGNGMLLSKHIRLQAAFNHLHIFIDPNPDAAASFEERQRMFRMASSTWDDYNKDLISKGGGVFSRDAKSIAITPEMKQAFAIESDKLTPNELISALLKAPVDLLWNGGIGTYVKASAESHAQVGDKANDSLRVNGNELRCKVIGEGGNLGVTQLGRVEFALNGGACNTDFIDNAAGVDCSDHEVNIKILLDEIVSNGDLTGKQRNQLLADMTEEVAELVLQNNYRQTQAISVASFQADHRSNEYRRFISYLESKGRLDRALEFLPEDEVLVERQAQGKYLTRPELSVLISYSKMMLKEALTATAVEQDPYIARFVETAFPEKLKALFPEQLYSHRLLNGIVATQVANDLINNLGITGGHRLMETTGASVDEVAKAYVVARDVFQFEPFNDWVRSLDNDVPADFQAEMLINMIRRVRRGTRWFLRNRRSGLNPQEEVARFSEGIDRIVNCLGDVLHGGDHELWLERCALLRAQHVPEQWIPKLAMPDNLFSGLGVVEAAQTSSVEPEVIARVFFTLMENLNLNWFASQVTEVKVETYWQAMARESLIDDIEAQVRRLSVAIMRLRGDRSEVETVDHWLHQFDSLITRWKVMVNEVQGSPGTDFAVFSVALHELIDLVQATEHAPQLS